MLSDQYSPLLPMANFLQNLCGQPSTKRWLRITDTVVSYIIRPARIQSTSAVNRGYFLIGPTAGIFANSPSSSINDSHRLACVQTFCTRSRRARIKLIKCTILLNSTLQHFTAIRAFNCRFRGRALDCRHVSRIIINLRI